MVKKNLNVGKEIIRSTTELAAKFNSQGWAKRLKFALLGLVDFTGKLVFEIDEPSYTDGKSIHVGFPKWLVGMKFWQAFLYARFALWHEGGHILYTPDKEYREWQKNAVKYLHTTYGFNEGLLLKVVNAMLNGMEDGREEACLLKDNPQDIFLDTFRFGRSQWYLHNDFLSGPNANSHEPINELFDGVFCLTTLATMGTLPMGWAQKWKGHGDLYALMTGARPYVNAFIREYNFVDGEKALWATLKYLEDWLVGLLKQIPVDDAQNAMQNVVSAQGGNASKNTNTGTTQNSAGSQGGSQNGSQGGSQGSSQGGSSTGNGMNNVSTNSNDPNAQQNGQNGQNSNDPNAQQSASALHDAFQGKPPQDGGRIMRKEDECDDDYGTDMEKIVSEAMAEAATSLEEDTNDALVQADWEDLCALEEEDTNKNGYDAKSAQEVADYYAKMDPNKRGGREWDVAFERKTYNLPKVKAPADILQEAKHLAAEFSKILKSKASFDAYNRRRGMLDVNGLHRLVGLKQDDIFMKKGDPRIADYVFYVLMDGSGSMGGNKFNHALRACSLIEESLRGIAPVKIVVFDFYDGVRHHIVKDFAESPNNHSWAYANKRWADGCNMDGFSIRVAKNELLRRSEKNKILITLSDGQPNGPSAYSGTRGENDVSEAVMETRKKGIHVFNIFFAEGKYERDNYLPSFQHMYRNKGIISCAPKDIGTELLRIVRRELK